MKQFLQAATAEADREIGPSIVERLNLAVAWFALAMFKLIAIEDVQHAGEGRVVCLHYIPNGPSSVCKNRHDEARIFIT